MADNKKSSIVNSGTTKDGAKFVVKKDLEKVEGLNNTFRNLLDKLKTFPLSGSLKNDESLNSMNDKISSYAYDYINRIKDTTGGEITMFLNKTLQNTSSITANSLGIRTTDDLFNNDSNNFSAFFFERYKNINNKYEDLRIITEYLYELSEAVSTMRDNIISADDLVSMISREIVISSRDKTTNDDIDNKNVLVSSIESMENNYKLKENIKNLIIPATLTYGNFFVYTIPYRDIFAQFEYRKKLTLQNRISKESYFLHPTVESLIKESDTTLTYDKKAKMTYGSVIESLTEKYNNFVESKKEQKSTTEIAEDLRGILEQIDICNNDYTPFMEDGSIEALKDEEIRNQALKAYRDASKPKMAKPFWSQATSQDSVLDVNDPSSLKDSEYKDIPGTFIKLYNPTQVIPTYVMDTCIGYYVLYEAYGDIKNSILLNSSLNRTNLAFSQTKRKELEDEVINVIADSICQAIDKKYVTSNPKFKELMVNAISYQDFYKRKFKVQFIPANYMTHFKINEDPETHMGTSVLSKSLFYGKLYLSLLLFKIITILTKSNDMRVYYIRNAGINKNMVNKVQEIARALKDKQISFNDLASIQTIFSKVGAYKEAFIPMGKSGEKNIEFDILSGQDVQLNTDLMELLRKGMINNTGVPSVLASYMEEADFARTLTMQHSKYLARIISLQTELESAVTEMYKKIMLFDNIIDEEKVQTFKFIFTRPKSLNNQDLSELISNAETLADFISKMLVDENDAETLNEFKRQLIKGNMLKGVFNWGELEELKKSVDLIVRETKAEKALTGDNGGM